jgi:hypothetical protein
MATTTPARASKTPAKKKPPAKPKEEDFDDIRLIKWNDDGSFDAELFDEETFTFSTDINAYLLLNAVRDGTGFLDLMDSLVLVDDEGVEDLAAAADDEGRRFHECLKRQKNLSIERLARLVGEITEIAGNESGDSSSSD